MANQRATPDRAMQGPGGHGHPASDDTPELQKERDDYHKQLTRLLRALASGPVVLPRLPGRPVVQHDQLLMTYQQLRNQEFPNLAQTLRADAGKGKMFDYRSILATEVIVKGTWYLAECLVLLGSDPSVEEEMFRRLKGRFAERVEKKVAQYIKGYYRLPPEGDQHLDRLLDTVLCFLTDLLTATPPGRLLLPRDGSLFDPAQHEPIDYTPNTEKLTVKKIIFPGYMVLDCPPRILAKAQVYTDEGLSAAPIQPPTGPLT